MTIETNKQIESRSSLLNARWLPIAILVLFFLLLSLISLGRPTGNDEGVWLYVGKMWMQEGMVPYVDTLEGKTPGIFYVYALASLFPGIGFLAGRLLAIGASVCAASVIFYGLQKYHSRAAGLVGTACFSLAFCWSSTGVNPSTTDTYVVLFVIVSWLSALKAWSVYERSGRVFLWPVLSGIAMGLATNFKQIAITSFMAFILVVLLYGALRRDWKRTFCALSAFCIGIVLAFSSVTLPLFVTGVSLREYWEGAWLILLQPGAATEAAITHRLYVGLVKWSSAEMRLFLPFLLCLLWMFVRNPAKRFAAGALLIWIFLDFLGVNASGRYYSHQFKQILPSLCVMAGFVSGEFIEKSFPERARYRQALAALLVTLTLVFFPAHAVINGISALVFQRSDRAREIGYWVRDHSTEEDYVQLAGGAISAVLPFTGRKAPGRLFHHCVWDIPGARYEFLHDVELRPPRYVIFHSQPDWDAPSWLNEWIQDHYQPAYQQFGIHVYERTHIHQE